MTKRNIPSRICDRCGKAYELYTRGRRGKHALRVNLHGKADDKTPFEFTAGFPDLCSECARRAALLLQGLVFKTDYDEIPIEQVFEALGRLAEVSHSKEE